MTTRSARATQRRPVRDEDDGARPARAAGSIVAWTTCSVGGVQVGGRLVEDDERGPAGRSARARPSRCRCPADRPAPPWPTRCAQPSGSAATTSSSPAAAAASSSAARSVRRRRPRPASSTFSRERARARRAAAAAPRRPGGHQRGRVDVGEVDGRPAARRVDDDPADVGPAQPEQRPRPRWSCPTPLGPGERDAPRRAGRGRRARPGWPGRDRGGRRRPRRAGRRAVRRSGAGRVPRAGAGVLEDGEGLGRRRRARRRSRGSARRPSAAAGTTSGARTSTARPVSQVEVAVDEAQPDPDGDERDGQRRQRLQDEGGEERRPQRAHRRARGRRRRPRGPGRAWPCSRPSARSVGSPATRSSTWAPSRCIVRSRRSAGVLGGQPDQGHEQRHEGEGDEDRHGRRSCRATRRRRARAGVTVAARSSCGRYGRGSRRGRPGRGSVRVARAGPRSPSRAAGPRSAACATHARRAAGRSTDVAARWP